MRHWSTSKCLSSKIFDEIHDHTIDLVQTTIKLIMGDGRIVKPNGIARNLEVLIFENIYQPISLLLMSTMIKMIM
jgi:hypothetical protein